MTAIPAEAVTAAQEAFAKVYNDPVTLAACLDAALEAAAPLIAAAERQRIRHLADHWRQEHWGAGDSFAAGAFARVVRRLEADGELGELIGYQVAGKMYHPADVIIVRQSTHAP